MQEQLIFDMTSTESTLQSLEGLLGLNERKIVQYIINKKGELDTEDFMDTFSVKENNLLNKELFIVSLHVTTNNDNCASIKKFGLLDLQKSLTLDTPLKRHLKSLGIHIDLTNKKIFYNDNIIDIGKKYSGINFGSEDEYLNSVIHKLFIDFQINAFFYSKNVLNYDGGVKNRPEFLMNLSNLLKDTRISKKWEDNTKCYVIKFFAPLSSYTDYSFSDFIYDDLDEKEVISEKIKSVIQKSLWRIHDDIFHNGPDECYSYIKPHLVIPNSQIMKIYTEEEYVEEYNIKE